MKVRIKLICCIEIPDDAYGDLINAPLAGALARGLWERYGIDANLDHKAVPPYRELKVISDAEPGREFIDGEGE